MYIINLKSRETGNLEAEGYASFDKYGDALAFAKAHEGEFLACGWYYTILQI